MQAIIERELKSYFTGLSGYVFGIFILIFAGIYTMVINLNSGYSNFEYVLQSMCFVLIVAIPILTMRVIAEERRQKTDQLLYALPLGMARIVLGKYIAMLAVIALPVLIMCFYPLLLSAYGTVSFASAYGSIIGFFFLSATLAAIGLFISSLSENQAVAAGVCLVVMLVLYFISDLAGYVSSDAGASLVALAISVLVIAVIVRLLTKNTPAAAIVLIAGEAIVFACYFIWPSSFEGLFAQIMQSLSVFERFYTFTNGVFDFTAIIYYLSVIGVSIFLTVQSLEKRRWN